MWSARTHFKNQEQESEISTRGEQWSYFWGGPLNNQRLRTDGRSSYLAPLLDSMPTAEWEFVVTEALPAIKIGEYRRNRFGSYEWQGER